ncbi:Cyp6a9 [Trypoxylus dichotomus]
MFLYLVLSLPILYYLFKFYVTHFHYNYWKNKNVYSFNTIFPWGNSYDLFQMKHSFSETYAQMYFQIKAARQKEGGFFFLMTPQYIPIDLKIIKTILSKDFHHFTDRGVYYNEKDDPLSAHLFTMEGNRWKALRSKLSPTFTTNKMKNMFPIMLDVAMEMKNALNERDANKAIEIKDILVRYTTDIIGTCAFGIQCNSFKNLETDFIEYGKKIFMESSVRKMINSLTFVFPNLMRFFRVCQLPSEVSDFFMKVVRDTVRHREHNQITRNDFLDLLIQIKNNGTLDFDRQQTNETSMKDQGDHEKSPLTIEQIAGQAFVFFLAGFETSSSTLSSCFYELALHEDVQLKLREEIDGVLEKHGGELCYDAIAELKYMDMVLSETLRKYPSVPVLNRICTVDYKVPQTNLLLEKGTQVIIPIEGLHNDPRYYSDPEKFDPERFSEERKGTIPQFAYLPFGEGPRICIGMRFGMLTMKIALTLLLKNFRFKLNPRTKVPLEFDKGKFLKTVLDGIWLDVLDR